MSIVDTWALWLGYVSLSFIFIGVCAMLLSAAIIVGYEFLRCRR